ncbi:MAG: histidinol-phosphatase [Bacteroidales bacterium]|nr:histidinol-phosphatase [Bacteroidales bacterium]
MKNLCYHSHNSFCDGKNSIEEMVESAIKQEVRSIGISSHSPVNFFNKWSINDKDIEQYGKIISSLQQKYKGKIDIFVSLEIDYIPEKTSSFKYFSDLLSLDYTIGAVHLVKNPNNGLLWFIDGDKIQSQQNMLKIFDGDYKTAVKSYFSQIREMLTTQKPTIIAHLDKVAMNTIGVFFNENEDWYQQELDETLLVIKKVGSIMELNTRGIYKGKWHTTFPSQDIVRRACILEIPIIISTDAHSTSELIAAYDSAIDIAKNAGYTTQSYLENNIWQQIPL